MRSTACLMLIAAFLAAGCDTRRSASEQANAPLTGSPDDYKVDEAASAPPAAGAFDRSHKGEGAPTLPFTRPDGRQTTLAAFAGKPVLVNLWATWCAPCVKELPTLDALAVREAGKLQVVTLSQDMDPAKVGPFFGQHQFKALQPYTDAKMAWVPAVASNLPTSILFDAAGREVWRTTGDLDWTGPVAARALAEA